MQPKNALVAILVTPLGIVTLVRRAQPSNALSPILVTLLGIVTLVFPPGHRIRVVCNLLQRTPELLL